MWIENTYLLRLHVANIMYFALGILFSLYCMVGEAPGTAKLFAKIWDKIWKLKSRPFPVILEKTKIKLFFVYFSMAIFSYILAGDSWFFWLFLGISLPPLFFVKGWKEFLKITIPSYILYILAGAILGIGITYSIFYVILTKVSSPHLPAFIETSSSLYSYTICLAILISITIYVFVTQRKKREKNKDSKG